jgi:hypothetical protein
MSTDKINQKLMELAKKELKECAKGIVADLQKKFPGMYNKNGGARIREPFLWAMIKDSSFPRGVKTTKADYFDFRAGMNESTLEHFLEDLLVGLYSERLHQKKVNDLVEKLEIFE